MRKLPWLPSAIYGAALLLSGCAKPEPLVYVLPAPAEPAEKVIAVEAGAGGPKRAQAALINAKPGDVIEVECPEIGTLRNSVAAEA